MMENEENKTKIKKELKNNASEQSQDGKNGNILFNEVLISCRMFHEFDSEKRTILVTEFEPFLKKNKTIVLFYSKDMLREQRMMLFVEVKRVIRFDKIMKEGVNTIVFFKRKFTIY